MSERKTSGSKMTPANSAALKAKREKARAAAEKREIRKIFIRTLIGGLILVVILCFYAAGKSDRDGKKAVRAAKAGNAELSLRLLDSLEEKGYDADKLETLKEKSAEGLLNAGQDQAALSLMNELTDDVRRAALKTDYDYAQAAKSYEAGEYSAAGQGFYRLGDYLDSASRYADCRCAMAVEAYLNGDEATARSILIDTDGAAERVEAAVKTVAAARNADAGALLGAELFQAETLEELQNTMRSLNQARETMPTGRVAAGLKHTVGLKSDGTVLAVGDNASGQCDVGGWTGIRQVAAGAAHTVGLKADGTVLAVGDNASGQCNVSGWTDIVMVAAASYDTIGLKSDGSVVACGLHADKVSGWHGVTTVTGGSYALAALSENGMMLCSHAAARMDMGAALYDLSVCGQVSVGVLSDGTLVSGSELVPEWTGIVTATATESGVLGVKADGTVLTYDYRKRATETLMVDGKVIEAESGGEHSVLLTEDGRVYAFGEDDYGQCAVTDWRLN